MSGGSLRQPSRSLAAAIGALADSSREHKDRIADARRHWDAEHGD
ncbi:hypothetical protein [Nocardia beijingensis]|uniref:Uncharacterized protein n=1 Tax=Nocardia beijingensis TaxID=95162 RepID=A0ABW7W7L6_9NOCA